METWFDLAKPIPGPDYLVRSADPDGREWRIYLWVGMNAPSAQEAMSRISAALERIEGVGAIQFGPHPGAPDGN